MRAGFVVTSYEDDAVGVMRKNERGAIWVSAVTLNPRIAYGSAKPPTAADVEHLHHLAHEQCFIANSVKTEIRIGVKPPAPVA
jgi:organic hydroperoxide reductase OsmC/OhrA